MQKIYYKAINFSLFSPTLQEHYKHLIIPSAHSCLSTPPLSPDYLIGIEARLDNQQLIGFILAQTLFESKIAEICSLMVETTFRDRGIGTHLLNFLQETLKQLNIWALELKYEQANPFTPALEKILIKLKWPSPRLYLIRCHYDDSANFNPPWYQNYTPPPLLPGVSLFLWKDLPLNIRDKILFQIEQGVFFSYLSPFRSEAILEPLNSFGLVFNQELIAWNITHRIAPDTIRYSSFYIDKNFQSFGYAIWLLVKSIQLQKEAAVLKAVFEVNYNETYLSWWRFVVKRLVPYADHVEKWNRVLHLLKQTI